MASNTKTVYGTLSTNASIPLSEALVAADGEGGTVTITASADTNTFTASEEASNLTVGAWLVDITNTKVYKVKTLTQDGLTGTIEGTFDDAQSAAELPIITKADAAVVKMSLVAKGTTTIDGVAIDAGDSLNFSEVGLDGEVGGRFVDPVIANGATGEVRYIITKF